LTRGAVRARAPGEIFGKSLDTMHDLTIGRATMHGFVRSAIMLFACILAAALLLAPLALGEAGSSGFVGLASAAGICLFSGLLAEAAVVVLSGASPLVGAMASLMVRMFIPLVVCVAILATGESGRDHLHFIGYLLTFYMVTLGLETWLAIKRSSGPGSESN
jgi:hypothetical protein